MRVHTASDVLVAAVDVMARRKRRAFQVTVKEQVNRV
jgi:hypothetical protein